MEEKAYEIRGSVRTISGHRNLRKFFPFRSINSHNSGFSLIELLVVIAVIGILAASVLAVIDPIAQMKKGQDGRRKSDLKQIQTGLELFRSDQGRYPTSGELSGTSLSFGGVTYMQKIPTDPNTTYGRYVYSPSGSSYTISACAEKPSSSDPDVKNGTVPSCTTGKIFQYSSP